MSIAPPTIPKKSGQKAGCLFGQKSSHPSSIKSLAGNFFTAGFGVFLTLSPPADICGAALDVRDEPVFLAPSDPTFPPGFAGFESNEAKKSSSSLLLPPELAPKSSLSHPLPDALAGEEKSSSSSDHPPPPALLAPPIWASLNDNDENFGAAGPGFAFGIAAVPLDEGTVGLLALIPSLSV